MRTAVGGSNALLTTTGLRRSHGQLVGASKAGISKGCHVRDTRFARGEADPGYNYAHTTHQSLQTLCLSTLLPFSHYILQRVYAHLRFLNTLLHSPHYPSTHSYASIPKTQTPSTHPTPCYMQLCWPRPSPSLSLNTQLSRQHHRQLLAQHPATYNGAGLGHCHCFHCP